MARLISYDYIRQKALADPDSGEAVVYLQDIAEAPTVDAVEVGGVRIANTKTECQDNQTLFVGKCTTMISAPTENERKVTGMDCFNYSCPFRVNKSSSINRCECSACPNRCNWSFSIASNRTLTDAELAEMQRLEKGADNG